MTCERAAVDADIMPPQGDAAGDARPVTGCVPGIELCGDGIDQDCDGIDPPCPPNDHASGAIDVTAGGNFTADLTYAHDDLGASCGGTGGRDIFYSVTLAAPQVYYFDTFGSSFDSVVHVYGTSCTMVTGATALAACSDDACAGSQSQLAVQLGTGTSCIVVDQKNASVTTGSVKLSVLPGGRAGQPIAAGVHTTTGNTCSATNVWEPQSTDDCVATGSKDLGSKDLGYFFTSCPGQSQLLDADVCTGTSFDSQIYVRRGQTQLKCNDDSCGVESRIANVTIANGLLFWLIVDGESDCGAFQLSTNLR